MKLYLVQHAKPKPEEEDPEKPLSDKGKADASKISQFIKNIQVSKVYHSGKLRAKQTADILAKSLNVDGTKTEDLEPMADPSIWADKLEKINDDVMLVGHLPHLNKLASLLLCKDSGKNIIVFQQGGVVCLEKTEEWSIKWMVAPDLLP
ncbi:MAG: conserved hypothetical protein [Marine Group I thaumarchaeote]|nr:MAG: conserved hypothetical protein [Marine Group I thaumarchaeote]